MSQTTHPVVTWPLEEGWNHEAGLRRLRARGWRPRFVYDVGASTGAWTATAARVFPLAEFHLFEPLVKNERSYQRSLSELSSRADLRVRVHDIALDNSSGWQKIGIAAHPMGSSMLAMQPNEYFPLVIDVETTTLDMYAAEHDLPPPDLVKIDTQGTELRILAGAERTLGKCQLLLVETWLERGYGPETPLLHEVVSWLFERGFGVADIVGEYREAERLVTLDLLFARTGADIDRSQ